jgi:hypothetical protein
VLYYQSVHIDIDEGTGYQNLFDLYILISLKEGVAEMKNKIPEEVISEIFPRKVKRSKLSEEVYDQLKKMILSDKFEKGQRLVEEQLARQLNVSRNPVQIAFLRLRKEKLVVWKYKKGTYVA